MKKTDQIEHRSELRNEERQVEKSSQSSVPEEQRVQVSMSEGSEGGGRERDI